MYLPRPSLLSPRQSSLFSPGPKYKQNRMISEIDINNLQIISVLNRFEHFKQHS